MVGGEVIASQMLAHRMFNEVVYELFGHGYERYGKYLSDIDKVTAEDIQNVAKKYFKKDAYMVHVLVPEE